MARILAFLLLAGFMGGCGLLPEQIDETKEWSAEKFFVTAKEEVDSGNFERAIQLFEKLQARYPYGAHAQQSELEVAYAYYKDNEPVSAIAACDRFIKQHPNHPNVDYAYYLKGLANFVEDQSLLASLGSQDMTERDPKSAQDAFDAFRDLINRFPDSRYAADSAARMHYLVNALASHEVHVARHYYQRGAYVAAANRGKYVLEHYQQSPALEEALGLMALSYERMGMPDLRDDARRVLARNFPASSWLKGEVARQGKSWWKFW